MRSLGRTPYYGGQYQQETGTVPQNKEIPDNSLVMGTPGKIVRQVTEEEIVQNRENAEHYISERLIYAEYDKED